MKISVLGECGGNDINLGLFRRIFDPNEKKSLKKHWDGYLKNFICAFQFTFFSSLSKRDIQEEKLTLNRCIPAFTLSLYSIDTVFYLFSVLTFLHI